MEITLLKERIRIINYNPILSIPNIMYPPSNTKQINSEIRKCVGDLNYKHKVHKPVIPDEFYQERSGFWDLIYLFLLGPLVF